VVVDGDRERPLRGLLADDVLVQDRPNLLGLREALELEARRRRQLLVDDLVTEIDALVADVDARAGDELLDLALRLPAEAAEKLLVRVGWTCQRSLLSSSECCADRSFLSLEEHRRRLAAGLLLRRDLRPFPRA
jgi:hypothetical protein